MKKILPLVLILTVFFGVKICHAQNQHKIDSIETLLKTDKEDTSKVNHLNKIAYELSVSNPDTSILLSKQALELAEKITWKLGIGKSYNILGICADDKGDYVLALDYYFKALAIFTEVEKSNTADARQKSQGHKFKANVFGNIGIIYYRQGDYLNALDYQFKALRIAEELGDKRVQGNAFDNIGNIYSDQKDYSQAMEYYFKALKIKEELGSKQGQATTLGNIAVIYSEQGDSAIASGNKTLASTEKYPKALEYYFKALKITEEIGNKAGSILHLGNIGSTYAGLGDYPKALEYSFKALKIAQELEDKDGIARNLDEIGSVYILQNKLKDADKFLNDALKLAIEIKSLELMKSCNGNLSELYSKEGNWKKTYEYYKQYITARDSINNEEKAKKQTRLEMNYEFDKKEVAIKAEQDKKDALVSAKISRQTLIRNSILVGIGIAALFSFLLVRSFIRRRKTSFEKQVTEVEMKALRAQMNPHFIFNSLRSINEYIQSHKTTLASEYLVKFSKLMRAILENSRQKEIVLSKEIEVLELYMQLESQRMEHPFSYTIEVDPEINPYNTLIPPMLLQPIVENSIRHGLAPKEKPGKIIIRIRKQNETIQCEVEDDGVGREVSASINKESKAESYGLKITAERLAIIEQIKKIKTNLTFHDLNGGDHFRGLNVTFALPLEEAV